MNFFAGSLRRNYNVADFDRARNFEQTVTYELPAGSGHRFFTSGSALRGGRLEGIGDPIGALRPALHHYNDECNPGTVQTVNQTGPYQVTHNVSLQQEM